MRFHLVVLFAGLSVGLFGVGTAAGIDIIDLHQNDTNGVPTLLSQDVTASGVVTVPPRVFDDYNLELYVQDTTAGVMVWVGSVGWDYAIGLGDSVTVTSRVAQYNGMTELGTSISYTTVVNHGPAYARPAPLPITCAELNATYQADDTEPNEGRLIRLDNLTITGGSWPETPQDGNSQVSVSDGTDEVLVYIDRDTEVNGSPQPDNGFSIVGLLKQYDPAIPYLTGYQLVPRYTTDVINPGGGELWPGQVRNVTASSATVRFTTPHSGSSEIEYGLDTDYGQTAGDPDAVLYSHLVALGGLTPNTIYHFRVKSTYPGGTSYGPDQLLAVASDQPGEIHLMMSGSAETEYAGSQYDPVLADQVLSGRLAQLINAADFSVDCALYSFSLDIIREALIAAHNRGCLVRLIIDQHNSHADADECAAAGIPYIDSGYAGNHPTGVMHNKFVVVDARDDDRYNDWVWTGSANMSYYGQNDLNNALRIRDYGLAQAYTLEFEEMWGSATQSPGGGARLGEAKYDDTPHEFSINGIRIEQYMSPSDGVTKQIVDVALSADYSIYFAILAFTHNAVSNTIREHRDASGSLQVKGVFEQDQGSCDQGSEYYALSGDPCAENAWNPPADVWLDTAVPASVLLHHKYLVADVNRPQSDPTVVSGSHNWSYSAETINDENTLIIHDAGLANQYLQEFAARYHESGGSDSLGDVTGVPTDGTTAQRRLVTALTCYPNPFNPRTHLAFSTSGATDITVALFDARGSLVRTLVKGEPMAAGRHILGWNGDDEDGRGVPSGVYFVRVSAAAAPTGAANTATVRLVLVR